MDTYVESLKEPSLSVYHVDFTLIKLCGGSLRLSTFASECLVLGKCLKNRQSVTYSRPVSHDFELGQDLEAAQPATSVTDANSGRSLYNPVQSGQLLFTTRES